jgi:hypothetical protein
MPSKNCCIPNINGINANNQYAFSRRAAFRTQYAPTGTNTKAVVKLAVAEKHIKSPLTS